LRVLLSSWACVVKVVMLINNMDVRSRDFIVRRSTDEAEVMECQSCVGWRRSHGFKLYPISEDYSGKTTFSVHPTLWLLSFYLSL
jgi:hypothetical protein